MNNLVLTGFDLAYTSPYIYDFETATEVANLWSRGISITGKPLVGWKTRYFTTVKDPQSNNWGVTDKYDPKIHKEVLDFDITVGGTHGI